jgi:hypothetical protein
MITLHFSIYVVYPKTFLFLKLTLDFKDSGGDFADPFVLYFSFEFLCPAIMEVHVLCRIFVPISLDSSLSTLTSGIASAHKTIQRESTLSYLFRFTINLMKKLIQLANYKDNVNNGSV